ncbi:MAG: Uma2 family endonuclease [Dehalococcoidia bacterium]
MTTEQKLLTAEDLYCLPSIDGRSELLDGRLVEMAPVGAEHNGAMNNTAFHLTNHVRQKALGWVLPGDTGVILHRNPDRVRCPDVCFIARERIPAGALPGGFLTVVPDLIVEIVSPSDTATAVLEKTEEWLNAGARLVWTLHPRTHSVVTTDASGLSRTLHEGDILTGGDVLPGFSLPVAALFEN